MYSDLKYNEVTAFYKRKKLSSPNFFSVMKGSLTMQRALPPFREKFCLNVYLAQGSNTLCKSAVHPCTVVADRVARQCMCRCQSGVS